MLCCLCGIVILLDHLRFTGIFPLKMRLNSTECGLSSCTMDFTSCNIWDRHHLRRRIFNLAHHVSFLNAKANKVTSAETSRLSKYSRTHDTYIPFPLPHPDDPSVAVQMSKSTSSMSALDRIGNKSWVRSH